MFLSFLFWKGECDGQCRSVVPLQIMKLLTKGEATAVITNVTKWNYKNNSRQDLCQNLCQYLKG